MRKQNFYKAAAVFVLAGAMMTGNAMPAFAYVWPGLWRDDEYGRTWIDAGYQMDWSNGTNNDSFTFNTFGGMWVWIDDNADGIAECYYFGVDRDGNPLPFPQYEQYEHGYRLPSTADNGYLVRDTVTPDGYTVNVDGEWVVDGVVQTKPANKVEHGLIRNGVNVASTAGAVTDGKSWPQITFDETLLKAHEINGLGLLTNMTPTEPAYPGQDVWGPTYSVQRKGKIITFGTDSKSNNAYGYFGPVGAFFNNFPEQGMELNAFYDNTGYESLAARRQPMATTGRSDVIFNLPQASYRMGWGTINNDRDFEFLLTAGEDGKWYIYPDSPMYVN